MFILVASNNRMYSDDNLNYSVWDHTAKISFNVYKSMFTNVFFSTTLHTGLGSTYNLEQQTSAVILNHISSHFLIPLSDSSLIFTGPVQ